jgi:hypothetical protein
MSLSNPDVAAADVNRSSTICNMAGRRDATLPAYSTPTSTKRTIPTSPRRALDPLLHYDQSGWHEGRSICGVLTNGYLNTYLDVAAHNIIPLQHYLQNGANEGRSPTG